MIEDETGVPPAMEPVESENQARAALRDIVKWLDAGEISVHDIRASIVSVLWDKPDEEPGMDARLVIAGIAGYCRGSRRADAIAAEQRARREAE